VSCELSSQRIAWKRRRADTSKLPAHRGARGAGARALLHALDGAADLVAMELADLDNGQLAALAAACRGVAACADAERESRPAR
jgi:hypothetical protein